MSNAAILAALANDGFKAHTLKSTNSQIARVNKKGLIKRLRRGLYAASGYSGPLSAVAERKPKKEVAAIRARKPVPKVKKKNALNPGADSKTPLKKRKRRTASPEAPATAARPESKRQKKAQPPFQPAVSIGRRISQIVNHWDGETTVEEVFSELAKSGFKSLDRQNLEPLVASVIDRKQRFKQF